MNWSSLTTLLALLVLTAHGRASAATFLVNTLASGFSLPLFATAPPGDSQRLFVLEQHTGKIRIIDLRTRTIVGDFVTVTGVTQGGEQGLLGMAFAPDYATSGYFYVNYTTSGGGPAGQTIVARYRVLGDPATSNSADANSPVTVLHFDQPESNHNGGWIGFGLDGYLYISTGDGGGGDDQHGTIGNAQDRTVLLGKMLRIDVASLPYTIPNGNPYKNSPTFRPEIWAFGLRNPWRCSFDRANNNLWIGDVGQSTREEVDLILNGQADLNFGWRPREGDVQNPAYPGETPLTARTDPIFAYGRGLGSTVTSGYVYRGNTIAELQGKYIFADFGSARFWVTTQNGNSFSTVERTSEFDAGGQINSPASFGEGGTGELFIVDYGGTVFEIVSVPPVANNDSFSRLKNAPGKVPVSQLLANDSDPLGRPLGVVSVSTPTANGASVAFDPPWVLYTPPIGFGGSDSFSYSITNSAGRSASATVTVNIAPDPNAQTQNIGEHRLDAARCHRASGGNSGTFLPFSNYLESLSADFLDRPPGAPNRRHDGSFPDHRRGATLPPVLPGR